MEERTADARHRSANRITNEQPAGPRHRKRGAVALCFYDDTLTRRTESTRRRPRPRMACHQRDAREDLAGLGVLNRSLRDVASARDPDLRSSRFHDAAALQPGRGEHEGGEEIR